MARIAGVDIPPQKRVVISMTYIMGIGNTTAQKLVKMANINPDTRTKDLSEEEVGRLRQIIDRMATAKEILIEGDLRRDVATNIKRLTEMQYQRNDTDFRRGTFRVHGDVLDIFPAEHADNALRLSLFDDEVESLQLFDPLTGHIRQKLARFTVFPSSHYVTGRHKVLDAVEKVKLELVQQKDFLLRR